MATDDPTGRRMMQVLGFAAGLVVIMFGVAAISIQNGTLALRNPFASNNDPVDGYFLIALMTLLHLAQVWISGAGRQLSIARAAGASAVAAAVTWALVAAFAPLAGELSRRTQDSEWVFAAMFAVPLLLATWLVYRFADRHKPA